MLRKRSKTLNDVTALNPELNEQLLFHGTRQQFVEPIYSQRGFDWRLAGWCIQSFNVWLFCLFLCLIWVNAFLLLTCACRHQFMTSFLCIILSNASCPLNSNALLWIAHRNDVTNLFRFCLFYFLAKKSHRRTCVITYYGISNALVLSSTNYHMHDNYTICTTTLLIIVLRSRSFRRHLSNQLIFWNGSDKLHVSVCMILVAMFA